MFLDQYTNLNLVGDIKLSPFASEEDCQKILTELEKFMEKYCIDKIDIGWSRFCSSVNLLKS
jgi:hypothetical protein